MLNLSDETFDRPDDLTDISNPAVLYARSYLINRLVVGSLALLLPIILVIGEAYYLEGGVGPRGSLSAYYHSSMRDLFVGTLCIIGILLLTYMAGQPRTKDFWLSFIAGVAVVGVVVFPTSRPDLAKDAPRCGDAPVADLQTGDDEPVETPEGCAAIQEKFGEEPVAILHLFSAGIFIISLGWLCFLFASRERRHLRHARLARFLEGCGWTIFGAIGWIVVGSILGANVWKLTPLYLGEVVCVWAFGMAWLVKSRHLWRGVTQHGARDR